MVTKDFEHLAQVLLSVRAQVQFGKFPADEYDRLIERVIWAIRSSPDNSPEFTSAEFERFIRRAKGEPVADSSGVR